MLNCFIQYRNNSSIKLESAIQLSICRQQNQQQYRHLNLMPQYKKTNTYDNQQQVNLKASYHMNNENSAKKTNSANRVSRTKQFETSTKNNHNKLYHARSKQQLYLTDTQASDYTKESHDQGQTNLNMIIRKLKKQNQELKKQLANVKTSQFYHFNQEKLHSIISQNQQLKKQLQSLKKELDQSYIQRNFLQRFNKSLKAQCQDLTRQLVNLNAKNKGQSPKNLQKSIGLIQKQNSHELLTNSRQRKSKGKHMISQTQRSQRYSIKYLEELASSPRGTHRNAQKITRNTQSQERATYRAIRNKSRAKQSARLVKKVRSNSKLMDNEYFLGKNLKEPKGVKNYKLNKIQKNVDGI